MKTLDLIAIADGKTPMPTEPVDVRREDAFFDRVPLIRRLSKVERRVVSGNDWIYWYWTPEQAMPGGQLDPGYSGVEIDFALGRSRKGRR